MVGRIYPPELQLTILTILMLLISKPPFLTYIYLFDSSKIYGKRDDFNVNKERVTFPILPFPLSQHIRFGRVSSHLTNFHIRHKIVTANC